ncbi:MAG TPA: DUF2179 domain-containing protein [Firmicutes bacterium]|nr:DUF2179 domain-containing protein [Bacillota bacterium]
MLPIFSYILIFLSRVLDVSLGTLRIIYLTRGRSKIAALIGFVEIVIYVVALGVVIDNLDRPLNVIIYALGFAAGTLVGGFIEEKIAVGHVTVQVVTMKGGGELEEKLREMGYGVTAIDCFGRDGIHRILHILMRRRNLDQFFELTQQVDHQALVSVMDTRTIRGGYFDGKKGK